LMELNVCLLVHIADKHPGVATFLHRSSRGRRWNVHQKVHGL